MAETYLIAGTASHVGKSTVAAGLCRLLADRGVDVAPFKAQNMSNNARAVPRAGAVGEHAEESCHGYGGERQRRREQPAATDAFGEIGVSQYVQARAARVQPTTDCNPVLLKPRGDAESQLVVHGEAVGHYGAGEYYEATWERAREAAETAHERLAAEHEVIVAEGAGAIAEPNLRERDLANVEAARFGDATILLLADTERGGAFASLLGTVELLPEDLRERLGGIVLTKFRGDASLLEPAIETVEAELDVPVLGVLPYDDPGLPAEDSVDLPARDERSVRGADDGVPADDAATVAVARLPRISNFTDLEPLAAIPGLRVSYRPLDATYGDADAVVVPGTKNAVDDLLAAREAGLDDALAAFDGPIVGCCGGYQLLGERITDADVEGTGDRAAVEGFGLLPVQTRFEREKVVRRSRLALEGCGPLDGASGVVTGYEIHAGRTRATGDCATPFERARDGASADAGDEGTPASQTGAALGAADGDVLGTYLHGLFENDVAREAFARAVFDAAGVASRPDRSDRRLPYDRTSSSDRASPHDRTPPYDRASSSDRASPYDRASSCDRASPYDRAANLLSEHADLGAVVSELD